MEFLNCARFIVNIPSIELPRRAAGLGTSDISALDRSLSSRSTAIWMLAFAWLDLFWLVMPVIPMDIMTAKTYMEVVEAHVNDTTGITNPVNFTMLAGVGGIYLWMTIRRFRNNRLLAIRDPRLPEGLAFENQ